MSGAGAWRPMREADLLVVVGISDAVHGDFTEPLATFADRLAHSPAGCAIFERGGAPLGYLISHPWPRNAAPPKLGALLGAIPAADSYYLHDIALLPAARGSGAGRRRLPLRCGKQQSKAAAMSGWSRSRAPTAIGMRKGSNMSAPQSTVPMDRVRI